MKCYLRHIFAAFALLSYSFGGVLIELTHHDEIAVLLRSKPVLEAHDCGAKEIHIAWEDARHCVACSQFTQRLSTGAVTFSSTDAPAFLLITVLADFEQTLETDILYSGKRGPPSA